jgi:hypothetical protein
MPRHATNPIVRNIRSKLQTNGLFVALAFISLIGFSLATWTVFTGRPYTGTFSYASVILGIGLIFESRVKTLFSKIQKDVSGISVMKIITFMIGMTVLAGGLLTLPFLDITIGSTFSGAIGFANLIAIFVILYELFLVD